MEYIIVVRDIVGPVPYWAADETLPEVRARFKRLTGRFPSSKAVIVVIVGTDVFDIDDLGTISVKKGAHILHIQN